MWHFPGSPIFLTRQAERLGLTKQPFDYVHASRGNPDLYTLSGIIGQLCDRFRGALKSGTAHGLSVPDLGAVTATLERCEREVRKLHLAAASADDMLAEAYRVFAIHRPRNPFEIVSNFDVAPLAARGAATTGDSAARSDCENA
jgi:hypothetical protein